MQDCRIFPHISPHEEETAVGASITMDRRGKHFLWVAKPWSYQVSSSKRGRNRAVSFEVLLHRFESGICFFLLCKKRVFSNCKKIFLIKK